MDSEHRHELEENDLAKWLAKQYEGVKPRLPAYGLGAIAVVVLILGLNAYNKASASAKADRWRGFTVALEGAQPSPQLLREAADLNAGTPVAEWAEITWADSKLYEASTGYFRDRDAATAAADEAIEAYERLTAAEDPDVAERAAYQLARAYELQGKLDEAREQYGRVTTGAFAEMAAARAEELSQERVQEAYDWITNTRTASATATADASAAEGDIEPDDIAMPAVEAENVDDTLSGLLDSVQMEEESAAEEPAAEEDSLESLVEETSEGAAEEAAAETPAENEE